eukprot:GHVU01135995.1.p2 GENE.GHVU01135995.1~~GHVU01135995.1.p2  ORF type:complete len:127 (-),score=11.18 GHVU01135995.1:2036-2374(-)
MGYSFSQGGSTPYPFLPGGAAPYSFSQSTEAMGSLFSQGGGTPYPFVPGGAAPYPLSQATDPTGSDSSTVAAGDTKKWNEDDAKTLIDLWGRNERRWKDPFSGVFLRSFSTC